MRTQRETTQCKGNKMQESSFNFPFYFSKMANLAAWVKRSLIIYLKYQRGFADLDISNVMTTLQLITEQIYCFIEMFFFLWCFKNSNLKPSLSKEMLQSFIIRKLKLHRLFNYTRSNPTVVLASSWLVFLARLFSLDVSFH